MKITHDWVIAVGLNTYCYSMKIALNSEAVNSSNAAGPRVSTIPLRTYRFVCRNSSRLGSRGHSGMGNTRSIGS